LPVFSLPHDLTMYITSYNTYSTLTFKVLGTGLVENNCSVSFYHLLITGAIKTCKIWISYIDYTEVTECGNI